jgi:trehalose 6-phosphate synthase
VDRLELSKNIVRGYQAYELFLRDHPEWRGRVRFLSLLPRSRTEIPEYVAYAERCMETAARINEELGTPDWTPIEIRTEENYPQAVAAYGLYDVLLVNPVFDGMNLVAMEGPLVNKRAGALILSSNAGAHGRLGNHAITVNPFDLAETADAIRAGLEMPEEERVRRERGLVRAVMAANPGRWLTSQLRDLDGVRGTTGGEGSEGLEQMDEGRRAADDLVGSPDEVGRDLGSGDGHPADDHA